jgi:hypothetical protein
MKKIPWSEDDDTFEIVTGLIKHHDVEGLRGFLTDGDPNLRNRYAWTPLMYAAGRGHTRLIRVLLDSGADVNAASRFGLTALASAAQNGHFRAVEMLLAAGATVDVPENFCGGSLLLYVKTGRGRDYPRISQVLSDAGAR